MTDGTGTWYTNILAGYLIDLFNWNLKSLLGFHSA